MTKEDDREADRLIEALTLKKDFDDPTRPHYYCRGQMWEDWWGLRGDTPKDVVYCREGTEGRKRIFHRIFGPAHISRRFDFEAWYKEGEFHREDGPAYRHKNNKYWLLNGKLHRLDGPAVDAKGHPKEYWINGQQLSPKEYKKEIARRKRKGLINE